jgi:7-carboxy-7-deazaguanine synthase
MSTDQADQETVTENTLVVAECYGPVWQGEGPSAGQRCVFLRTGGCNLTCGWRRQPGGLERVDGAWACDEPQTWHSGWDLHHTLTRAPISAIMTAVLEYGPMLTVITGGEPLIHQNQPGWEELLHALVGRHLRTEVETNGTLIPRYTPPGMSFNVSPKLASSGLHVDDRIVPAALAWHAGHGSVFKFVCTSPDDVAEAASVAGRHGASPGQVWIMPEGTSTVRVIETARLVAPAAAGYGFNLTLRQQVLLYDKEREPKQGKFGS